MSHRFSHYCNIYVSVYVVFQAEYLCFYLLSKLEEACCLATTSVSPIAPLLCDCLFCRIGSRALKSKCHSNIASSVKTAPYTRVYVCVFITHP